MTEGFVYLDEAVDGVFWDERYATEDNFTGAVVDGYLVNRVVCSRELARALRDAARLAAERGFGLMVWDAYRPQRAVDCFVRWAASPEDGRTKQKHYPNILKTDIIPQGYVAPKSRHSRGSAVDLTLCGLKDGVPVDMDGDLDLMDEHSHHGAQGVSGAGARNRRTLLEIMEASGFEAYESEWWHYALRDEPYPDTYFDFPIDRPRRIL